MKLEELILGHLLMQPELLKSLDIDKGFFKDQRQRLIFKEIQKGNGDLALIAEKINVEGITSYLNGLLDGITKTDSKNLPKYVNKVKINRLKKDALKLINDGAKTGNFEHEKLAIIYQEIQRLDYETIEEETCETVEDLSLIEIPEIDWLIKPIIERCGFTLVGGQKGVGKSLYVTQLGLYAASGNSPFLIDDIVIERPLNVLLIQQEVSLPGLKDRLIKMRIEKTFNLEGRFRQKTTTGDWWDLTKKEDYKKLLFLLEKYGPDILILDPLYTFYPKELNTSGDISPMMKILSDLKTNFNLALVVVHHFSNKEDPDIQRPSVGRFMGHSMIANSADVTIGLDFLHPKYRQQALPLPYQNYIMVEVTTRHGEWPARFALERKQGCLLFEKSSIWQDLGRSIVPGQIEDLIEANDGEMLQKDVIHTLLSEAKSTTIKRAIDEAVKRGTLTKETLQGKGNPVLLRSAK